MGLSQAIICSMLIAQVPFQDSPRSPEVPGHANWILTSPCVGDARHGCRAVRLRYGSRFQDTEGPSEPQPPETVAAVDGETMEAPVEVGYEVGLHAPEFAMSLLDGTGVTASGLSAEGKPVFLYFHATY